MLLCCCCRPLRLSPHPLQHEVQQWPKLVWGVCPARQRGPVLMLGLLTFITAFWCILIPLTIWAGSWFLQSELLAPQLKHEFLCWYYCLIQV